jgi:iron complex outermembrane receptor protein
MNNHDWIAPALSVSACLAVASLPVGVVQAQNAGAQAASQATGEGQLEEIVITAERRVADIQKSANSITVRSGTDLQNQGRYSLAQILEDVPGVLAGPPGGQVTNGTDTTASGLIIRGIPSGSAAGGGAPASIAPSAAVYVDGVYEGIGGGYDIDRVEVLRGPQGTLYGRSATSGLISTYTANPSLDRVGGNASVEFGNYALRHYSAAVNVPLVDDVLAVRVSSQRYERDGYFSAAGGAVNTTDGRIKVLYKPNDDLSVLLGAALQNNHPYGGGVSISIPTPNTFRFTPSNVTEGHNKVRQYWAEVNWNLGFATLTWQPAYRTFESASNTFFAVPGLFTLSSVTATPKDHFHTEELRLVSNGDMKLSWLAGVFYYNNDLSSHQQTDNLTLNSLAFNANLKSKATRDTAVYVQATYDFTDTWRLTGGLRYDVTKVQVIEDYSSDSAPPPPIVRTTVSIPNATETGKRDWKNTTFKARVEHDLTAQNLLYGSISTGFTPGDVALTQDSNNRPFVNAIEAETLISYEIGSKNRFLDNALQVNGDLYYYDYGAYQTAGVDLNLSTAPGPQTAAAGTLAAPVQVIGAELETIYQLTPNDRVGLNLGYTDAYFVGKNRTKLQIGANTVTFADYFASDKVPRVAPFTANLSYDHSFTLPGSSKLTLHGDARYFSAHDQTNVKQLQVPLGVVPFIRVGDEVVANVNVTWASSSGNYSVTGYVRNIGDNQYKSVVSVLGNVTPVTSGTPYDPRTYGVVLNARF